MSIRERRRRRVRVVDCEVWIMDKVFVGHSDVVVAIP
jgi:hypothetical protein